MSFGTKFSDNFWDSRLSGYMLLYQNMRRSRQAAKDLEGFLRDSASIEDQYHKQLAKINQSVGKFSAESSSMPLWLGVLKEINSLNDTAHAHFADQVNELLKQVQAYTNKFRQNKNTFKQSESGTVQLIEQFRSCQIQLKRAKQAYFQTCSELDKQKKVLENAQPSTTNSNQILIQKLEKKLATQTTVYESTIDSYNSLRDQVEESFSLSCNKFEQMEKLHLDRMKEFLSQYLHLVDNLNSARTKNLSDCRQKLVALSTESLLEQFMINKSIGNNRPVPVQFVHYSKVSMGPDKSESKLSNLLSIDFLSRIKSVKKKTRTNSANAIDLSKMDLDKSIKLSESIESGLAKASSLDSIDFKVSSSKQPEGDMVNYYESSEELEHARTWTRSSDSWDDESDDSDMPKKIFVKINPIDEQTKANTEKLNEIGKSLKLTMSLPEKKSTIKMYKMDENNNILSESPSPICEQPPPLPPLPKNLLVKMNQRFLNFNSSIAEPVCTNNLSENDQEEVQF